MATSDVTAFLKESKHVASDYARRYRLAFWLAAASLLVTGLLMRPSEITVIVLGVNVLMLWLAIGLFWRGQTAVWLIVVSQILAVLEMTPTRLAVIGTLLSVLLLTAALVAARLGGEDEEDA